MNSKAGLLPFLRFHPLSSSGLGNKCTSIIVHSYIQKRICIHEMEYDFANTHMKRSVMQPWLLTRQTRLQARFQNPKSPIGLGSFHSTNPAREARRKWDDCGVKEAIRSQELFPVADAGNKHAQTYKLEITHFSSTFSPSLSI